jgi:hypothetical protein
MRGKVLPASSCEEKAQTVEPPAPKTVDSPPEESKLWLPEVLSYADVTAALGVSLSENSTPDASLELLDARFSKEEVALRVKATGTLCGTFWVRGRLSQLTAPQAALGLTDAAIVEEPGKPSKLKEEAVSTFLTQLTTSARIPLVGAPALGENTESLVRLALGGVMPEGLKFSLTPPQIEAAVVQGAEGGLYVTYPITSKITVTDL